MNEERDPLDGVGAVELYREWMDFFGFARGCQMIGWCVSWVVEGHADDLAAYRKQLGAREGCSERSAYRALKDLKAFKEHLVAKKLAAAELEELALRATRFAAELT